MASPYFNPYTLPPWPCWHCVSFPGKLYAGTAARCARLGASPVMAMPSSGCAYWMREVGADDQPGQPAVTNWDEIGERWRLHK